MYQVSDHFSASYTLVMRPKRECFIGTLPAAFHVFQSLKTVTTDSEIMISDMLPDRYLYKPLILDTADVSDEKQYLLYKKIKKAKYVHRDLFSSCFDAAAVMCGIECGDIRINGQFMKPVHEKDRFACRKQFAPGNDRPVVYRVTENDLFNVHIRSGEEMKDRIADIRELSVNGTVYVINSIQQEAYCSAGEFMVLQADGVIRDNYQMTGGSESIFRLGCSGTGGLQVLKAGSMPDRKTFAEAIQRNGFIPFARYGGTL